MKPQPYRPQKPARLALDRAWEVVQATPYKVSLRFVFYVLFQEGFFNYRKGNRKPSDWKAAAYETWTDISAIARRRFYQDWKPDTFADDTRQSLLLGHGHRTQADWLRWLAENIDCQLSKWHDQEYYVELWYEARAMTRQFQHYTDYITLRPMAGQASLDYLWGIAKELERFSNLYQKPIVILYFGDLDKGGSDIEKNARETVREWSYSPFEFIRCGLNPGDPEKYNLTKNPDKPDQYQWESLSDENAGSIITSYANQFAGVARFSEIVSQELQVEDWLKPKLLSLASNWQNGGAA